MTSSWLIALQAIATYAGLGSAACFAVPLFRSAAKTYSRDILQQVRSADPRIEALVQDAIGTLSADLTSRSAANRRYNIGGAFLLGLSLVTYTGAFFV